jgi:6-phosphogluconolactonase (cycloisomerase 2 family)
VFPYSIAFAPNGLYAYVVNPTNNTIAAYSVAITGQLTSLGVTQVSGVAGLAADTTPISVSVDPSGAFVYTANYSDNSVTVFPVTANGTLGTPTAQTFGNNPISIVTVAN